MGTLVTLGLKLLGQPAWKLLVGAFLILTLGASAFGWFHEHQARKTVELQNHSLVLVNDSTQARLARVTRENGTLQAIADAAKPLGGKPVAGVTYTVKSDTIYLPAKPVPTTTQPDSTRVASFTDSTKGYKLRIEATAPPFPAPLRLGYTLVTPEFHPQVGFVKAGDGYYAVVSSAGQTFTTKDAFFVPPHERALSLNVGSEIWGAPQDHRIYRATAYAGIAYETPTHWTTQLEGGYDGKLYVGLRVQKRIW